MGLWVFEPNPREQAAREGMQEEQRVYLADGRIGAGFQDDCGLSQRQSRSVEECNS